MAILVIQTGKHAGRQIKLPSHSVVIGRDDGCFLKLSSTDVSRKHCELKPVGGAWVICDLGSQNGTFVNGEKINGEIRLAVGDDVLVGHMHFQWEGPKKAADTSSVLDDSIADWLTERDTSLVPGPGVASGDTTILTPKDMSDTRSEISSKTAALVENQPVAAPSATAVPLKKAIPLADEAREVIRKFVEEVGDGKPPALGQD